MNSLLMSKTSNLASTILASIKKKTPSKMKSKTSISDSLLNIKNLQIGKVLAWISIFTVALWSAWYYPGLLSKPTADYKTCSYWVQKYVPADSFIVVSNPYNSVDEQNIPNNYQEPMVFFYSQRKGWSLPADWLTPEKFEQLRKEGAQYYVILDRDLNLLTANPEILNYINANFNQLDSGIEPACRIYQFK